MKQKRLVKNLLKRQADTMQNPYWITMMDDTNNLYSQTISAFDLYWQNRKKPIEEDINEGKNIYNPEVKEDSAKGNLDYVFEYKRFIAWEQKNQYRIKPDGRIMTEYDILQQWKKSKQQDTAQ